MIKSIDDYLDMVERDDHHNKRMQTASDEIWVQLIDNYPELHTHIVLNKTLSPEILEYLARHSDDEQCLWRLASIRRLNYATFELLAKNADSLVRCNIAYNTKSPKSILEFLAKDKCTDVFDDDKTIADIAKSRLLDF